jgi:WD40 repeat protein
VTTSAAAPGRRVNCIAFSPDGKSLAGACNNLAEGSGEVKIWDVATGKATDDLKGHAKWVECVAFSRDGKMLATGGGVSSSAEQPGEVRLWQKAKGTRD